MRIPSQSSLGLLVSPPPPGDKRSSPGLPHKVGEHSGEAPWLRTHADHSGRARGLLEVVGCLLLGALLGQTSLARARAPRASNAASL